MKWKRPPHCSQIEGQLAVTPPSPRKRWKKVFLEICFVFFSFHPIPLSSRFPLDPQSYQLLTTNQRQPKHLKTKQLIFSHQPTHTPSRTEPNPIPSFSPSNLRAIQKPSPGKNRNPIRLAILFVHLWSAAWCVLRPLSVHKLRMPDRVLNCAKSYSYAVMH